MEVREVLVAKLFAEIALAKAAGEAAMASATRLSETPAAGELDLSSARSSKACAAVSVSPKWESAASHWVRPTNDAADDMIRSLAESNDAFDDHIDPMFSLAARDRDLVTSMNEDWTPRVPRVATASPERAVFRLERRPLRRVTVVELPFTYRSAALSHMQRSCELPCGAASASNVSFMAASDVFASIGPDRMSELTAQIVDPSSCASNAHVARPEATYNHNVSLAPTHVSKGSGALGLTAWRLELDDSHGRHSILAPLRVPAHRLRPLPPDHMTKGYSLSKANMDAVPFLPANNGFSSEKVFRTQKGGSGVDVGGWTEGGHLPKLSVAARARSLNPSASAFDLGFGGFSQKRGKSAPRCSGTSFGALQGSLVCGLMMSRRSACSLDGYGQRE